MTAGIGHPAKVALAATLGAALLCLPQISSASPKIDSGATIAAPEQSGLTSAARSKLNKSQFQDVQVKIDGNGILTLTGDVGLFQYKADAEKRVSKVRGVAGVRNRIEVAGPAVPDAVLQAKLGEKLSYDRVGYGNTFNAITLSVQNGVVTLGGHARTDVDRDSAIALVSTYRGVKGVVAAIAVDPVSIMDDRTRIRIARAVYGYPTLNKYALDPAKPIRIAVQNGRVELYGVVDSAADKETAFLRANGVSGVFKVENDLQVAGQPAEAR